MGSVLDHLDRGSYHAAIRELGKMDTPDLHWKRAFLTASYAHLGRTARARESLERLLEVHPEFPDRVETELDRWRFPEQLRINLLVGLEKAGMKRSTA
jgi:hypothetical protein